MGQRHEPYANKCLNDKNNKSGALALAPSDVIRIAYLDFACNKFNENRHIDSVNARIKILTCQ
ncbi:MAG: hypothetical protein RR234_08610, partial [Christensenella sp.]